MTIGCAARLVWLVASAVCACSPARGELGSNERGELATTAAIGTPPDNVYTNSAPSSASTFAYTGSDLSEPPGASTQAPGAQSSDSPSSPKRPWAARLAPLVFHDVNTMADVTLRLYRDDGAVNEDAVAEFERVLWAAKDEAPPHVSRRLLQLVVKAAAHFGAQSAQVISSHRTKARKGSRHRSGEAIDFIFPGVEPKKLAALLRTYPRVGVGLYVHPRAQYVHLDVRDQSYHWVDGSPPGRTWREQALPDPTAAKRDAAYNAEQDLPEMTP
ncbi:MAG: DUF882 domain-containing protein [Polyangiaceae bacterium]|nr:DUF882 domain-containing protein [Polyangiaceae bacterium]